MKHKQQALKPQDLVVALKLMVNEDRVITYAQLGRELFMSASEVHAATQRAELSRLISNEMGEIKIIRSALHEFILHGVKYAFPATQGGLCRGMPTSIGAYPLSSFFAKGENFSPVWPDDEGEERGLSLHPLYPSVPKAAKLDSKLYEILALIDALRSGAAREREIALKEIYSRLL